MSTLLAAIRAGEAEVSDVRTEVIGTLAESPARFSAIQLHVSVDSLDRELLEHVVEIAERTCIMMNTLRGTLDLRVQSGVPVYAPQMRARTTPGFFHKSRNVKLSSSPIIITGGPPEEIFEALCRTSLPPGEPAHASSAAMEGK
jgi:hypothetical protein